jgi:adenylate cyclase
VSAETLRQRLAAILAADAAGYSRLMTADDRATVVALDAAREVFRAQIESSQGRVIDMAGDSVLAVFELATTAVTAALAIQESLDSAREDVTQNQRMRFRIGVHLGEIIEKPDGTVYGDGVNIATRLQVLADPGGIVVSDLVRNAVKGKVTAAFEDLGEQTMKNIADPVRAFRVQSAEHVETARISNIGTIDLSLPDKPSIAVLPFTTMSGDPEQEYFTDGVSEEIITELSRFHSLFVIARNSSFSYKGKSPDIRRVGRELGVRYVLEGSIRRAGNRIRITTQLIDSLTGNHIWADRYDRVLEDIFEVQEEVTRAIISAIAPQIEAAEREKARRRRPESLSAYEIAVRANANAREGMHTSNQALCEQAIREAREALAIDPRSVLALNVLAFGQWQRVSLFTVSDRRAAFEEGLAAATKAIEVDPSDGEAHSLKAWLLQRRPDKPRGEEALPHARRAYELNPNSVNLVSTLGHTEIYAGDLNKGVDLLRAALRMSPRDPFICYVYLGLAIASCLTAEYANGVEYARHGISSLPAFGVNHAFLAINYAGLGEIDQARAAFNEAQRLNPGWIEPRLRGKFPFRSPEHIRRATTLLKIAGGLEDPSAADALR